MAKCPIMSRPIRWQYQDGSTDADLHQVECLKENCQLWTKVMVDGIRYENCAYVIQAFHGLHVLPQIPRTIR